MHISANSAAKEVTSSSLVNLLKDTLIDSLKRGDDSPYIAAKTCDGCKDPAVQADPPDTAKPAKSKLVIAKAVSIPFSHKFKT